MEEMKGLLIVAAVICSALFLIYRADVWGKKSGWLEDEK